jgi:hypothetical protein
MDTMLRSEPPGRPRSVGLAFALLWVSLVVGLVHASWRLMTFEDRNILHVAEWVSMTLANALVIGLFFWLFRAVATGRNWGRVTVLGLAVVATLTAAVSFRSLADLAAIDAIIRFATWIAATVLLFTPASSAWYRAMKAWRDAN